MKKLKAVPWALGLLSVAALVLLSAQSARSVYSSPVNVVNTPANPVPVMDTRVTTSFDMDIGAGGISASAAPAAPTCPAGQDFLVTGVFAAPDWFGNEWITALGRWSIRVNVMQRLAGGGGGSHPILLYGTGPQHVSAVLPAGQPAFSPGRLEVLAFSQDGPLPSDALFVVHVSGYCGTAFGTP